MDNQQMTVRNVNGRLELSTETPVEPIRVFLISDFQILIEAVSWALSSRQPRFALQGVSSTLDGELPWGSQAPDVVMLDMDLDHQGSLRWLKRWENQNIPKVLLLSRNNEADTHEDILLHGGYGLLGRGTTLEQLLMAVEKIHQGQMWVDHTTATRLMHMLIHAKRANMDPVFKTLLTLTEKERRILSNMLRNGGDPAKVIAEKLFISESTLRNHLTSIYHKLGVRNRSGLISQAVETGLAERLSQLSTVPERRVETASLHRRGPYASH